MLRVGLDISALDAGFKAHAHRGIGRYVLNLKSQLESMQNPRVRVGTFDHKTLAGPALIEHLANAVPFGQQTLRQQVLYPWKLTRGSMKEFDILHFPAHMDPPAWGFRRYAVTVLDLIPLVCADLYKADKSGFRFHFARWLELKAIKNASLVLAISENTARDVERLLHVPPERIVVTPLGVDEKFFGIAERSSGEEIRSRYGILPGRPVILYVGGIDPRKNYPVLLKAFKKAIEMCAENSLAAPVLFMAGAIQADREFPKLKLLMEELGIQDSVITPGYIADEELLRIYAMSSVFFFPSLYEGFGLPPLEAMAAGVPVVSSNASSMPEVLGDAAHSFNPRNDIEAAGHLFRVISSPALAEDLRIRGRSQARKFSWSATAAKTLGAYEKLIHENGR